MRPLVRKSKKREKERTKVRVRKPTMMRTASVTNTSKTNTGEKTASRISSKTMARSNKTMEMSNKNMAMNNKTKMAMDKKRVKKTVSSSMDKTKIKSMGKNTESGLDWLSIE